MTDGKDEIRITPAVIRALAEDDLANALVAAIPGGIEAQEAAGQRSFVADESLPIECNFCKREQLEAMGISFGEPIDDLFVSVQLPEGWEKVPAPDHSMWSYLMDDKGRERASIFYKAAFYDRSAHISLSRRYNYTTQPIGGYTDNYSEDNAKPQVGVVTDCGEVIWQSEPEDIPEEQGYKVRDALRDMAKAWLEENYPDWEDPLAYWD